MSKETLFLDGGNMSGSIGCLADGVEYITNAANNILHAVKYSFIADLH